MTKWETVKEFINSNEKFTKKDLKNNISGFKDSNYQYIIRLMKIGILDRTELAHFKRVVQIPKNISYTKIRKLSYENDKVKLNFLTLMMRKEKLQNIKNINNY